MSYKRKILLQMNPEQAIKNLIQQELSLSSQQVKTLFIDGKVFEKGRKLRFSECERINFKEICVYIDSTEFLDKDNLSSAALKGLAPEVLYEDESIIVVNKPYGLSTQPTIDKKRANLFDWIKNYTKGYVGLHHRLDKDTSGVILFTKSKESNFSIAEQFKNRTIQKTYIAICEKAERKIKSPIVVKNFLKKEKISSKMSKTIITQSGGDFSETYFEIIPRQKYLEVLAKPKTGRMHQIRVHLSSLSLPIIGDTLYGSPIKLDRFFLHAWKLKFHHPVLKNELEIEAPLPKEFQEKIRV